MTRFSARLGMRAIALAAVLGSSAGYAAENAQVIESKQVGEALIEAKQLAAKKQWAGALEAVRRAGAAPDKSPYADYKIDEYEAYLLMQQQQYGQAAPVYERMAQAASAPQKDVPRLWQTAAQLYMQTKAYDKAVNAASHAVQLAPGDPKLLELLGTAQYLAKNYRAAAATLEKVVSQSEKAGKHPNEELLKTLLASYDQLHDEKQIEATWEKLLAHYPKPEYWQTVLRMKLAHAPSDALKSSYRRLMFDVGVLEKALDYEELALSSIEAGVPNDAVKILEQGFARGRFAGAQEARYKRMLEVAKAKAAETDRNAAQLSAKAGSLPPESSVALGRIYMGRGEYDKAIAELQRGIASGSIGHVDQVRIDLGIAYLKAAKPAKARESLLAVNTNSEWRDVAELWGLRAAN